MGRLLRSALTVGIQTRSIFHKPEFAGLSAVNPIVRIEYRLLPSHSLIDDRVNDSKSIYAQKIRGLITRKSYDYLTM